MPAFTSFAMEILVLWAIVRHMEQLQLLQLVISGSLQYFEIPPTPSTREVLDCHMKWKKSSLYSSQVAIRSVLISRFCSIKQQGIFQSISSLDGMLGHPRLPPTLNSPVPILTLRWREAL